MKRLLTIILIFSLAFTLTACNSPVPVQEPQAPAESPSEWEQFVQEKAAENITEADLHTIENIGFSQQEVMEMTTEEINELLAMIRAHADQQKIDSALEILSNIESAKTEEELVFCDGQSTARLELIEEWLKAKKNFDTGSVWGVYSDGEEEFVFILETENGMPGVISTYWMTEDIITGRQNPLEKTLDTEEFYEFTDTAGNTVTITKTPIVKYPVVELFPSNINEFEWEDYLAHMQQLKGLSESDLRSLNNMGLSRQDIMDMSDEEIADKLHRWKQQAEYSRRMDAEQILTCWEEFVTNRYTAFWDDTATAGLELVENWYTSVQEQDGYSIWGMTELQGRKTAVYLYQYLDLCTISTYWMDGESMQENTAKVTKVTKTAESYQITDETGTVLTIPTTQRHRPVAIPFGEALGIHAAQVKEFKYEIIGVTEGKELTLQNTDAANAAKEIFRSKVMPQEGREMNPIVGGEFTRYTLTLLNGTVIVIEDNGMISVNEKKNIYCWEEKEEIALPEDAVWNTYTIDPFGGEENPVT